MRLVNLCENFARVLALECQEVHLFAPTLLEILMKAF